MAIHSIKLQKLPSGVYQLDWVDHSANWDAVNKSYFYSKAQLMALANEAKTYKEMREFLRNQFQTGEIIK